MATDVPLQADDELRERPLFAIHWQLNSTVRAYLGCGERLGRYRAANGQIVSSRAHCPGPLRACGARAQSGGDSRGAGFGPVDREGRRGRAPQQPRGPPASPPLLGPPAMKKLLVLPLALLGASCMTAPPPPPAPYHAVGTEPFWSLLIDEHDLTFTQPDAQPIRQPTPRVIHRHRRRNLPDAADQREHRPRPVQRRNERPHLSRQGPGHGRRATVQGCGGL